MAAAQWVASIPIVTALKMSVRFKVNHNFAKGMNAVQPIEDGAHSIGISIKHIFTPIYALREEIPVYETEIPLSFK
ncbi:hypothetical protein DCC81_17965 [Chitinophaga parva]|uniref:Uncharacterized protein n=1 Tax=Chitinophaga parva TaxID=2169414 RepID=A0A2T7BIL6_9BACT|nr:hypothetical protein [Chitinophaga parva]PUZ26125.1 hypothetical protein DCC81_17965 [Chitinophaga parva]